MSFRIGFGIDVHQLTSERALWLGGVHIPHTKGLLGHSDADVLLHAICDAMLGALALGDIGIHFPNTDDQFKNIESRILLRKSVDLIQSKGYKIVNIDSTICLEKPIIRPYIASMQQTIAAVIGINKEDVSVKATTTEKLGYEGREEGITAYAVVLLEKNN
jgi:2-C-methyl-D-erythritol 2,4-cyclodiphosphate synthase